MSPNSPRPRWRGRTRPPNTADAATAYVASARPAPRDLLAARRILVYGVTGSGKSTAAAGISKVTGIPWTSVDDLAWQPGWVPVPVDEQRARFEEVCAGDSWLLDTAYGIWLDVALARADLVVALDYPRWFSLQRLVRRTAARILDRRPICNGNTETLRGALSAESIIAWHFRSFSSKRKQIVDWCREAAPHGSGFRVARFTSARDLDRWIEMAARETDQAREPGRGILGQDRTGRKAHLA